MSNIGIIGHGFVGKSVEFGFSNPKEVGHNVRVYDKFKDSCPLEEVLKKSEVIFVCLPTPFYEDKLKIDLSIYDEAIDEICPKIEGQGKIVVIKSTVVPGTTESYAEKYPNVPFAFNPEFLTEANYLMDFINPSRIVIGASNDWVSQTMIMLYRTMPHFVNTKILTMGIAAAEMVKYQSNVLLAAKIAVCNVFYDLCQEMNVQYTDVKKGVGLDPRIGYSHMSVTTERGFGGKCVLGNAMIEIDGKNVEIKDFFETFNPKKHYNIASCTADIDKADTKKIIDVTSRLIDEEIYEFKINSGIFSCTGDHLMPVFRNGKIILIEAREVSDTDKLFIIE